MIMTQKEANNAWKYMTKYFKKDDENRKKAVKDDNVTNIVYTSYLLATATKDILNAIGSTGSVDLERARHICDRVKADVLDQLVEEGYE